MADDLKTLNDLILVNNRNLADIEVSDVLNRAPLLYVLAADYASNGTKHSYTKQTGAPVVGFRTINNGRDHDKSEDSQVDVTLQILDASFHCDSALADAFKDGPEAYIAREALRHIREAMKVAESQFINGIVAGDATGYTGLQDSAGLNHTDDEMVYDAGGAAALSSVYAIRTDSDMADVTVITGQDGNISIGTTYEQMMTGANGKKFNAYVTPIQGWLGLQIGGKYSVARLCNIDAGANSLSDALLSHLLELFPEEAQPTHLVMNRRSRFQLQRSRTATTTSGAEAPLPSDFMGIPIVSTGAVKQNETQVVASV